MNRIIYLFLLAGISLFSPGCSLLGDDTPSKCGDKVQTSDKWSNNLTFNAPWEDPSWNSYTEDNFRVFQVSGRMFEDVCPEEEIKLQITGVMYYTSGQRNIQVRVKYRYSVFGNTIVPGKSISQDHTEYDEGKYFGIKNAYDGIPGSFYCYYEWVIDNYQDYEVDLNYFKTTFDEAGIDYTYYKF